MRKSTTTIGLAAALTLISIGLGYVLLGLIPMLLFAFGFLGGFIVWLLVRATPGFAAIRVPYFLTLGFFIVHKLEERFMLFFPRLSDITHVPVPETNSFLVYGLYACAAAWLLIPHLVERGYAFGYYLAWTFFTSMGVTELAHFAFPLLEAGPYGYFPGMASVVLLAPAAWWGMARLSPDLPARVGGSAAPVYPSRKQ